MFLNISSGIGVHMYRVYINGIYCMIHNDLTKK